MNVDSIHHLMNRSFLLEQKNNSTVLLRKTKVECVSSAQKSFLACSWRYAMNAGRVKLDWGGSQKNTTISNSSKKIQSKRCGNSNRNNEICIHMQHARNLARMTAALHCSLPSDDDLKQEFEETSSEEEGKARDPSPDPTARQDFWCIMKITYIRMLLLRGRNSMFRRTNFRYV